MENYLYHMTEYGRLNSIFEDGLLCERGITANSVICLGASVEGCIELSPMCSAYWACKSYYDRLKDTITGHFYYWKTTIYEYPVLKVNVSGIECFLDCISNTGAKTYFSDSKKILIPEYRCSCDIPPDRIQHYTNFRIELDTIDFNRMRPAPELDWMEGRTITKSNERITWQ